MERFGQVAGGGQGADESFSGTHRMGPGSQHGQCKTCKKSWLFMKGSTTTLIKILVHGSYGSLKMIVPTISLEQTNPKSLATVYDKKIP